MDDVKYSIDELKKDFQKFMLKFEALEKRVDDLYRELGTREGQDLYRQVDEMQQKIKSIEKLELQVARDVASIRKLTEYGDERLKEIMQALSLIYRNTDELEENLIDEENLETR